MVELVDTRDFKIPWAVMPVDGSSPSSGTKERGSEAVVKK